jgi:hypothetical protein
VHACFVSHLLDGFWKRVDEGSNAEYWGTNTDESPGLSKVSGHGARADSLLEHKSPVGLSFMRNT